MNSKVEYGSLSGFSRLFLDFVSNYSRVKDLFSRNPYDETCWEEMQDILKSREYNREELVKILGKQNRKFFKGKKSKILLDKLLDPDCSVIVTGQQAGLFLGPLYTIYKAVTAVKLAAELEERSGRPVVPLFWLEVDDHDFDEVRQFYLLSQKGDLKKLLYSDGSEDDQIPVGKRYVETAVSNLIDDIQALSSGSENAVQTIDSVKNIYQSGISFPDAFMKFFRYCYPELPVLFVNPADPSIKRIARSFFEQVITQNKEIEKALDKQTGRISNRAYEVQVSIRQSDMHLFVHSDEGRVRLTQSEIYENGSQSAKNRKAQAEAYVDRNIENLSGDVLLRPVFQDFLFPTCAYVAGPSELSYLAQLKGVYKLLDIPMPVVYPRWSGSVVDDKTNRFMKSVGIQAEEFLSSDHQELLQKIVEDTSGKNYDKSFRNVLKNLGSGLDELRGHAEELDKSLVNMIDQSEKKMEYQLEKIRGRFTNALQASHKVTVDRSRRAHNLLLPADKPQERIFPVLEFLLRYGSGFAEFLEENISTDTDKHHIINLTVK